MKYTVLTLDSAVKFFGDLVALSSIISSRSIQKTIIMKQICRLPSLGAAVGDTTGVPTTIQKRSWFQASTFPLPLVLFSLILGWKVGFSEGEDCRAEGKCVEISVNNCDLPPALIS